MSVTEGNGCDQINRRKLLMGGIGGALLWALPITSAYAGPLSEASAVGPLTPVLGSPSAKRTLAVYFDYHCPFCRAMDPLLNLLVQRNPDLRILFKEFPVLRLDSQLAARIALSAQLRGRYFEVHERLMHHSGDYTGAVATDIGRWLNVDVTAFRKDMGHPSVEAELQKNAEDADAIGVQATPAVVTALSVEQGARNLEQLQVIVDALRHSATSRTDKSELSSRLRAMTRHSTG